MEFVDSLGNSYIPKESDGVALVSNDGRCKWGIGNDGRVYISIDDDIILSARAWMRYGERWLPLPYRPINIKSILYKKTYASKTWRGHRSRNRRDRLRDSSYTLIEDREVGGEVGFHIHSRLNDVKVNTRVSLMVLFDDYSEITVDAINPIKVELATRRGTEMFIKEGNGPHKFRAGIR